MGRRGLLSRRSFPRPDGSSFRVICRGSEAALGYYTLHKEEITQRIETSEFAVA